MIRQFKPVRFTVLIGVAAFIVCGVAVFYTHRTAHGTTAEEQAAYESGEKAGKEALSGATLPTEAELNVTAQKYFEQQGPAEQLQNPSRAADLHAFKQAFEKGLHRRVQEDASTEVNRSIHRKPFMMGSRVG